MEVENSMSMRGLIVAAALGCLCVAAPAGQSFAADCPVGSQQTLSGKLMAPVDDGAGGWTVMPLEFKPCAVFQLRGKGKLPASCDLFKRFSATGTVRKQDGSIELVVASIRCS
jgi:hypothetical protein